MKIKEGKILHTFANKILHYNRSLTGEGTRETLKKIKHINSNLKIKSIKSGTKVFDWTIPPEWIIHEAFIKDSKNKKIIDFKDNNLHVVNYSAPIKKIITLNDLDKKLHSIKDMPDAIPYITSYYKKDWGFCIQDSKRKKLKKGNYEVNIKSKFIKGHMNYGEIFFKGRRKKEILLSTYICHPSMANDGLSGIAVLTFIAKFISKMRNRKFSYRIVFAPETIGSIAFINKNINNLKKNVYAGFNVTCIGDNRSYSYLPTRNGSTISDEIAKHVLLQKDKNFKKYLWKDRGSDERQYNAPGVDLPVASLMRTKYLHYKKFPEYHTSLDDLEKVVTPEGLQGGYDLVKDCLIILERNYIPKVTTLCEPQLSKKKLYPEKGLRGIPEEISLLRDVISYSDGTRSLLNIANICGTSFFKVFEITEKLHKFKLIKKYYI